MIDTALLILNISYLYHGLYISGNCPPPDTKKMWSKKIWIKNLGPKIFRPTFFVQKILGHKNVPKNSGPNNFWVQQMFESI